MESINKIETVLAEMAEEALDKAIQKKQIQLSGAGRKHMTIEEAAEYLNLSVPTIYTYLSRGLISYYKPQGKIYISVHDLDQFVFDKRNYHKSKQAISFEVETKLATGKYSKGNVK